MPGYVALPAYRPQGAINFDPLNEGLDDLSKQFEKNRLLRQAQAVGAALAPDTAVPTTPNPLMVPQSALASPAQASAAAAGRDFPNPTSGTDYSSAIKKFESGGRYDAVGPITDSGDRAYGAHQVMGKNIPSWTQEVLGQSLTPQQYLANPDAQEKVFAAKFGQFVNQTGNPQDAASMWFTGKPLAQGANRRDILGTTGTQYVNNFNANLGGAQTAPAQAASAPSGPNYRAAAAKAFEFGNVALGTQLLQQQTELDNQAYTRSHQAQQEATAQQQWQAGHGLQVAQNTRAEATFANAQEKELGQKFGAIAQTIANVPDPAQRQALYDRVVSADPRIEQHLAKYGVAKGDADTGIKFLIAEAMGLTGGDKTGTTPQYYDVNGDLRMGVVTEKGAFKPVPVPGQILPTVKLADQGTQLTPIGPGGVKMGNSLPKDVAGEAAAKEGGKSSVERQNAKPQAQLTAETAISGLDRIKQEIVTLKGMPSLSSATGNLQSRLPNVWQSTADADSSIRNLKNKLATTALQAMRDASKTGGAVGNVTEKEWPILESMIGNLDPSQGDATFVTRLGEIENYVEGAKARISGAYQQTYGEPPASQGGNQPAPVQGGAPRATNKATGQVLELNPQTNQWEAVQ